MEQQPNYGTQGAPAQAPTQAQQQQQYGGFPPAQENTYLLGNMWGVGNAMPLNPALTAHFLDYRALVFRGIVALIFSITAFALPFETVQAFVWIYAGSMCAIGTVMMITGVSYCMGMCESFVFATVVVWRLLPSTRPSLWECQHTELFLDFPPEMLHVLCAEADALVLTFICPTPGIAPN